jgi:AcrR family transcriptional regulator
MNDCLTKKKDAKMPRTSEQFEEMREKSRRVIEDAALSLFAKQGFDGTTIKQIAKEAKIAGGLIYNYYPSKEKLMRGIIDTKIRGLVNTLAERREDILAAPTMRNAVELVFEVASQENAFWRLMIKLTLNGDLDPHKSDENHLDIGFFNRFLTEILTELYRTKAKSKDAVSEAKKSAHFLHGIFLSYMIIQDKDMLTGLIRKVID